MNQNKIEIKNNKKKLKNIRKEICKNELNPYIANHYISLKEEELEPCRIDIIKRKKVNNLIIKKLKEELNSNKKRNKYNETIVDAISDLEYKNGTENEILKLINLRKNEFYYMNLLKKKSKKNNKKCLTVGD